MTTCKKWSMENWQTWKLEKSKNEKHGKIKNEWLKQIPKMKNEIMKNRLTGTFEKQKLGKWK